jgi:hypothetical protein
LIQIGAIVAARRGTIKRFALRTLHGALQQKTVDIHRLTVLGAGAENAFDPTPSLCRKAKMLLIAPRRASLAH